MGTVFTTSLFPLEGRAANVESFFTVHTGPLGMAGHYATFASLVHGIGSVAALKKLRREHPRSGFETRGPRPKALPSGYWHPELQRRCLRFPGSDASIVKRSQIYLGSHPDSGTASPVRYSAYFTVPSLFWTGVIAVMGATLGILAGFSWGKKLLLAYPRVFSLGMYVCG